MGKRRDIPRFEHPIIETHCHLDYLKSNAIPDIIQKSVDVGIEKIITIAVEPGNFNTVLDISHAYDNVYCTQGVHPHQATTYNDEVDKRLRENQMKDKVVAVGEIGLDYYYNKSPRDVQINAFEKQLQVAVDCDRPVVIHSRDAEDDTIAILKNFAGKLKGEIHSFTSKIELAEYALAQNFYLGFNGIITFKNAENVRDAVRLAPMNQIILETDSPYLTPDPYRGKENAPYYLPFVVEKIAEIKNLTVDEVLTTSHRNSLSLFPRLS